MQKARGVGDAFSFLLWTFQPVLFSICYFISCSLGDTCWVGGVLHGLPGPHPATWCLGHMYSPGTDIQAPGWWRATGFGAGGGELIPKRQRGSGRWDCAAETLNPSACSLDSLTNGELLRTPYNDCKALNPKNGTPFFVLGPNTGPHVIALATHPCISPGISKCNHPSNFSFSDLPESCSYEGRVFQDGEDWPLSSCAKCMCRNGVTQCFVAQCQPLFCNKVRKTASEWILPRLLTSLCRTWSPF